MPFLDHKLKQNNVKVIMIAPDFVFSQIHKRALNGKGAPLGKSPFQKSKVMTAEACAKRIVISIKKGDRLLIISRVRC